MAKSFDALLAEALTDIQNQFPAADVSQGSAFYLLATRHASALWGLYNKLDALERNIHPDTSDTAAMDRHAFDCGLTRKTGETDAELCSRILAKRQNAPAAGRDTDYEAWATAVDGVESARCISAALGAGTVDVVILADSDTTGSEIPSDTLLSTVAAAIAAVRPTTVKSVRVLAPTFISTQVTMTLPGASDAVKSNTALAITSYMAAMGPGDALTLAKLTQLAINEGATDVVITLPSANVTPNKYGVIRPGTVTVS